MKQQKWDDSESSSKEFVESGTFLPEEGDDIEDGDVALTVSSSVSSNKSRVTELRRRIEERLDSKRIALEYDYEDFDEADELAEALQ